MPGTTASALRSRRWDRWINPYGESSARSAPSRRRWRSPSRWHPAAATSASCAPPTRPRSQSGSAPWDESPPRAAKLRLERVPHPLGLLEHVLPEPPLHVHVAEEHVPLPGVALREAVVAAGGRRVDRAPVPPPVVGEVFLDHEDLVRRAAHLRQLGPGIGQ